MPTSVVFSAIMASSWTAAAGFAFSMSTFVTSMIISGLSMALTKKPEQQQAASIADPGRNITTQSPIAPWRIIVGQTRVPGVVTYKKMTDGNTHFHQVITLAGHVCESIDEIWFGDEVVPLDVDGNATGRYAGYVRVKKSLGGEAGQPFPDLVAESLGEWSDAHRQSGRTKIYVRCIGNSNLFPTGLPNITAVVKGMKCHDPRSGLTVWTDNPPLIINAYLTNAVFGMGADYTDEINETDLIAAANICDELVTLADGSTEKRYTCNGTYLASEKPIDIIGKLASSMAGYAVQVGAQWNILAGAYDTPTLELDEDDLAGQIQWTALVSRREGCNAVKGVYVAPENNYQATDFPAVSSDTYLAQDGGNRVYHDLELNFTDSGSMAQRLAKIELLRTRQGLSVNFTGKLTCFRAQPGKTILLTIAKYGWASKPFFVANGTFAITQDGRLGYNLQLRETATEVYDWNTAEESAVDFAPNTDLGDPLIVGVPGVPSITESKYETTGSAGVKVRVTMTWAAPDDGYVNGYLPEYKLNTDSAWIVLPKITGITVDIDDMLPARYDFRVCSVNVLGVKSDYTATTTKELIGLTTAPADITNFAVRVVSGQAQVTLDKSADLDVLIGGRVILRWSPLLSGATWNHGTLVSADRYSGDSSSFFAPLIGTGTYMAKFEDSTGNVSATAASFVVTEALMTGFTTLATATEHPAFSGGKANIAAVDGGVQLVGSTLWDDMGPIDSESLIDSVGGIVPSGIYTFANGIDLGSVTTVRLFPTLKSLAFDTVDTWDRRTDLIDDWGMVDGDVIEDAEVALEVRATNDNPSVSPTWSDWHVLPGQSDYTARGFQCRARFSSSNVTHNRKVTELALAARQPT